MRPLCGRLLQRAMRPPWSFAPMNDAAQTRAASFGFCCKFMVSLDSLLVRMAGEQL